MPVLESFDGLKLHYDVEGSGPPVVLLHGFAADTQQNWRSPGVIAVLAAAGRQVVGLDARGHGLSDKPHEPAAYENGAMVKDVAAVFDALGLHQADLAGYSMGSATAMRFAREDARIRRLVLGGTSGRMPGRSQPSGSREEQAAEMAERGARIAVAMEAEDAKSIEDPLARAFRRFADRTGADRTALAAMQRARRFLAFGDVAEIRVPTLVICGDKDVSPHRLAASLADGRAEVVSGDHLTAVADPAFATKIVEFLGADSPAA
jgi:pimeloyl-ACP methyl ester carboxylesterase